MYLVLSLLGRHCFGQLYWCHESNQILPPTWLTQTAMATSRVFILITSFFYGSVIYHCGSLDTAHTVFASRFGQLHWLHISHQAPALFPTWTQFVSSHTDKCNKALGYDLDHLFLIVFPQLRFDSAPLDSPGIIPVPTPSNMVAGASTTNAIELWSCSALWTASNLSCTQILDYTITDWVFLIPVQISFADNSDNVATSIILWIQPIV